MTCRRGVLSASISVLSCRNKKVFERRETIMEAQGDDKMKIKMMAERFASLAVVALPLLSLADLVASGQF